MADEKSELEGLSLSDLMGIDTTGMEAKRAGEVLPKMFAHFECIKTDVRENKDANGKIKSFAFVAEWKVLGIENLIDKSGPKEADLVGKSHFENRFVTNSDGIKYVLGYLEDVGIKERGALGVLWNAQQGRRIAAVIAHRKNPNDADQVFSGLTKIKPIAA